MEDNFLFILLVGTFIGAASGYLGSFMVVKRMSLVGDALSHVALPGIAVALMIGINPMLGALIALTISVFGIWYLQKHTDIYEEALVGVLFTASLAIGLLITPEPELFESLFGDIEGIGMIDATITAIVSVVIFLITGFISKKLMLGVVSEDLAKTSGVNVSKVNLVYLLLVGLIVALGVKFVGTLLTGALVIIPAVSAKNLAKSIGGFQVLSSLFGIFSAISGMLLARSFDLSIGPTVVLASVFFFVITLVVKPK